MLVIHVCCSRRGVAKSDAMGSDLAGSLQAMHSLWESIMWNKPQTHTLQAMLYRHTTVFNNELGCMKNIEVELQLQPDAKPKFFKPHSVPFIRKKLVEEELLRLESLGIISPVKTSKWAVPIVPVVKRSGAIRVCGDFTSINRVSVTEFYPLPRIEELFTHLQGGKQFTKLDMASAYLQLPLAESAREFLTVNTHMGLYRYNRLPFGVASAPAIFQRTMETLLRGIPGVSVYRDRTLSLGAPADPGSCPLDSL